MRSLELLLARQVDCQRWSDLSEQEKKQAAGFLAEDCEFAV